MDPGYSDGRAHTPCIGVCDHDGHGCCVGCHRTLQEIGGWGLLDSARQDALMRSLLQPRALQRRPFLAALEQRQALQQVLHRLDRAPQGPGWNHAQLADLLPATPPVQAAVLLGLVPRPQGTKVLLTRRTEALRNHGGQVGFPGGRIESSDRHPAAAALRESQEEIGLEAQQVAPIGFLDPFITISNYRVQVLVAAVDPDFVPVPSPDEVAEVFEVPLAFLMDMDNLRAQTVDYQGRQRSVLEYSWPGQRIWGATAAMLANLHQRLEQA